jgi:hypothetical protein
VLPHALRPRTRPLQPGAGLQGHHVSRASLWATGHGRVVGHHLASYQLNQVGNPSLDPYKYLPTSGNQHATLYL